MGPLKKKLDQHVQLRFLLGGTPASIVVSLVSLDEHLDLHPSQQKRSEPKKKCTDCTARKGEEMFDPLETWNLQEKRAPLFGEKKGKKTQTEN